MHAGVQFIQDPQARHYLSTDSDNTLLLSGFTKMFDNNLITCTCKPTRIGTPVHVHVHVYTDTYGDYNN